MRCLQCGKRLPLFRKIDGDFCTAAHAAEYAAREQTAALARLKQATQQEVKSRSVWERRRKLKSGDLPPAEMRGLVSLSLPNAVSHRTFQRVVANPRRVEIAPVMPMADRGKAARIPAPDSLFSDILDPVDAEFSAVSETLEPLMAVVAPRRVEARLTVSAPDPDLVPDLVSAHGEVAIVPELSPAVEEFAVAEPEPEAQVASTAVGPEEACAAIEPPAAESAPEPAAAPPEPEVVEARFEQLAISAPDTKKIPVRIRRPYAQSTPLRPGRKPIVLVRLDAQPVPYESCDPVREPAGLVALGFSTPRTVPASAVRLIEDPAPPARGLREAGHPMRLSALALLHTAVGLAALDGVLQPNPGAARPITPLPEAVPVRAPGKIPAPAFAQGSRTLVPARGLPGARTLPLAQFPAKRCFAAQPAALLEAAPLAAGMAPPVLPCSGTGGGSTVGVTANWRLAPLPESQYPQPRNQPAPPASIPAEPAIGRTETPTNRGLSRFAPLAIPGTALRPRLLGLDAPEPIPPRVAVARRPDAVAMPPAAVAAVGPSLPECATVSFAPAAGKVPIAEPEPLAAPIQAHSPAPARVESQTGLAIVTGPVHPAETLPPVAGPVPIVFDVRAATGSLAIGRQRLSLLPPELETAMPGLDAQPAHVTVAAAERPPDGRQQARTQAKAKSAFSEAPAKPQPAFGKAGKPAGKRYVPGMTPARPPVGRPGGTNSETRGDPPMASRVGIYAIVPAVRGSLEPRTIETDLTWRKRRHTAGIRYEPSIDKLDWVTTGRQDRLKPLATFAEKNGGARFNLIDEIGVPGGLWQSVQQRWRSAPAAVKWALPAVLVAGLVVALPMRRGDLRATPDGEQPDMTPPAATIVTATAPQKKGTAGIQAVSPVSDPRSKPGRRVAETGWKARLRSRAAVVLVDDFRAGLGEWMGDGNWARGWAYDLAGFVRPGALGIYSPTLDMTDYQMELLGQIDRRSLGWIVRASDTRNYYAMKLVVAEPGPVPKVVLERYAVVRGVPQAVNRKSLHFTVRNDTSYRILTEVHGNDYAVAVQGNLVDSWTETRLDRGGVGLLSTGGDQARIRWISVTHQDDLLGKLCAFFAPPSLGRDRGANE